MCIEQPMSPHEIILLRDYRNATQTRSQSLRPSIAFTSFRGPTPRDWRSTACRCQIYTYVLAHGRVVRLIASYLCLVRFYEVLALFTLGASTFARDGQG